MQLRLAFIEAILLTIHINMFQYPMAKQNTVCFCLTLLSCSTHFKINSLTQYLENFDSIKSFNMSCNRVLVYRTV